MLARVDRFLAPLTWLAAALVVVVLFAGPSLIGAQKKDAGAASQAGAAPSGRAVFASAGCGGCHTLAAAGSTGATGPNLDDATPSAARVQQIVTSGEGGMPAFASRLSAAQIKAVAQFVSGTEAKAAATPAAAGGDEPTVAKTIRAGRGPDGITVDDEAAVVWVADATAGRLVQIDVDDNARTGSPTPAGREPDSPVVADDGILWAVASGDDAVLRIEEDGTTKRIGVGRAPESLAVGKQLVWVTNAGDGTVTRIDRDSGRVAGAPIRVGTRPLDVAAGDDVVWVTNFGDDTVTRIDPRSGEVQGRPIPVGHHPRGVDLGAGSVWVANAGDGTVTRIDAAKAAVAGAPITVGRDPREIAVGEGFVWVANAADDTVTRIDPAGYKVLGEPIEVGDDPIGIAVGAGAVWTANFRSGDVTRIEP